MATTEGTRTSRLRAWMLEGLSDMGRGGGHTGPHAEPEPAHQGRPWWRVMCLTGVDYFSTLGYQPGIAALAAGLLSPVATIVLVIVTLAGALPVYRRVAEESPRGEGSIAMLERLLTFWKGKLFVLTLLGFAATDFLITITLSAADASTHLIENPHLTDVLHDKQVLITLILIALLGAVFLKGFLEAIGVAVALVALYLALNVVVVVTGLWHVVTEGHVVTDWSTALTAEHGNVFVMIGVALIVFPKLALGLSGFETGVAVMPHVKGEPGDTEENPKGRIRDTKKLLTAAAVIMSVFLVCTSFITTLLIPEKEFEPGGDANGRALAYLAHDYLGNAFGTVYDVSTIAILWFAGASAMAGLLNLMPRYLPRYGMAPHWARAVRPMVIVFTLVAFLVTWIFDADVDAQGGAYATGVLVLISSAAIAVTIAARKAGQRNWTIAFGVISAVFLYTTVLNVIERPDGVKIGACFIAGIILVSLLSRLARAFELRVTSVQLDGMAERFVRDIAHRKIRFIANEPDNRDLTEYREKIEQIRHDNDVPTAEDFVFVEVTVTDPSEFEAGLAVRGEVMHGRYRVLTLESSSIPNALAALLLHVRDATGAIPHIYFEWTEGGPFANFLRFFLFGQGEVAPVTREVLREAERNRARRPRVHVG
ncbi:APC family permease [Streptomyces europaeiscabiei]|uniref:APC family permease n=1 Tax=Streptomyces europaeiscabiei TaxID=146819 RepID=A0ABU4NTV5_9ACTN|nr:APC family permease [Streptomyces europaeiscabiei]MDX2759219.1 APC family permease [Streptomyces europaeiscabiei]MDX2766916.1 APC family permease [Streptomyces europaeiscabiei]MDX3549078.1 APC family permease [Streptomyces europaeiscabiei]MDX3558296.1 APC family permease [Streptomyces europaeiscabiei]MDX3667374.1 APC family permease [Streptomyces europaeiscabiei]